MHNHELIFGKQQQFQQQKKLIANKKYECFTSTLTKISIFELRIITSGTHPPH